MALTLTVDAASIEEAYTAKLKKYAKDIQMKGFRKGKAPLSVLEAKFGSAIREEATFDCMEENLKACIETLDEKDKPLPFSRTKSPFSPSKRMRTSHSLSTTT